jgi:hypothetical protein
MNYDFEVQTDGKGIAAMSGDFETYAMRGAVATLGAAVIALVGTIWSLMKGRFHDMTQELKQQRAEFTVSVDSLNATIASLGLSIEKMNTTNLEKFATKEELKEAKTEIREAMRNCREDCPDLSCQR